MYKFEASNAMIPAELRPWEVLQTQTPIKSVKKIDYHPINSLSSSDTVNFDLPSLSNFMLKNIQIVTQVIVEKNGVAPKNEECFFVSNPSHALWQHVELTLNNRNSIMNPMAQSYNLEAFFETIFNESQDRSDKLFAEQGFLLDDVKNKAASENLALLKDSDSANKRSKKMQTHAVTFINDFNCSFIRQGKLLPTNLPMVIALTKNKSSYPLIQAEDSGFELKIKQVFLRVTYVEPQPSFLVAFNSMLAKKKAIYECSMGEISTFSVPPGNTRHTFTNLFTGKLPHFMVFAIQDREAIAGNSTKNPFTFHPFKSIQLFINNKEYFPELLECDIENDDYTLMINQFNEALGYDKRGNCLINSTNFKTHFMLPVALSSDRTINLHHNLQEVADFKVLINFDGPTPADQVLLIYSSAEKLIQIDLDRNIEIIQ